MDACSVHLCWHDDVAIAKGNGATLLRHWVTIDGPRLRKCDTFRAPYSQSPPPPVGPPDARGDLRCPSCAPSPPWRSGPLERPNCSGSPSLPSCRSSPPLPSRRVPRSCAQKGLGTCHIHEFLRATPNTPAKMAEFHEHGERGISLADKK